MMVLDFEVDVLISVVNVTLQVREFLLQTVAYSLWIYAQH